MSTIVASLLLWMIYQKRVEINTMEIDSTFWVAVSFFIFFGALIYLKVPQKVNETLNKLISDIKNEIDAKGYTPPSNRTILIDNYGKRTTVYNLHKKVK